jgi:hypothetical protein
MTIADKYIETIKAEFKKQKEIDPDAHVNDWTALLHYQSLNGDGLYATINQLQSFVTWAVEAHIKILSLEERQQLTQEAFENSDRLFKMDFWNDIDLGDKEPKETGMICDDAIQIYFEEMIWQKIDEESFEMETEDEDDDEEEDDDQEEQLDYNEK